MSTTPSFGRTLKSLLAAALTLAAGSSSAAAAQAKPVDDQIVELPKFVVTDVRVMPEPESWRYASLPGIEVLSNESDTETERLIRDLHEFRQVMDIVAPMPDRARLPLKLIVCGARGRFDEFLPPAAKPGVRRLSYLLSDNKAAAIVLDSQSTVLVASERAGTNDPGTHAAWRMDVFPRTTPSSEYLTGRDTLAGRLPDALDIYTGMPTDMDSQSPALNLIARYVVEPERHLRREYVKLILGQAQPKLPLWFEEGFTQIMTEIRYERDFIEVGRVEPIDMETRAFDPDATHERQFNAVLAQRSLIPFDELFSRKADPDRPINVFGEMAWRKQAEGFVHLCMFGRGGKWKPALVKFIDRSAREPVTEALFKECFGMSYYQLAGELRDYTSFTDHSLQQFRGKNGKPLLKDPPQIAMRDATDAEVGRIKGHAFVMAGRTEQARAAYIAPYFRGERDPQLLAGLGLFELKSGKPERALKFLTTAVAANTTDPEAYTELARIRLANAIAAPAAPEGKLSKEQTLDITTLLMKAHSLPPQRTDTYELMADVWSRSAIKPAVEHVTPLIQGAVRFPGRMKIVFAAATFSLDAGLAKEARALVEHGLKNAPDDKTRSVFAQLKTAVPNNG